MRTTVTIDDQLLERAKRRARKENKTLGDLVEDALRELLVTPPRRSDPPIRTSKASGGFRPGIDPLSNRSLYDALDEDYDATKIC